MSCGSRTPRRRSIYPARRQPSCSRAGPTGLAAPRRHRDLCAGRSSEFLDSEQVVQDPWILVPALFAPAYIGGRTAAEHWDLTEQIFRDIRGLHGATGAGEDCRKPERGLLLSSISVKS